MLYPDNSSLVPILHRFEPHQKCITVKYFLIFMKAPPNLHGWMSGESWLCRIYASFSCLFCETLPQGLKWAETQTAYPFLLDIQCCHGNMCGLSGSLASSYWM